MLSFTMYMQTQFTYITKLIPTQIDNIQEHVYINVSDAAVNCNKTGGFFTLNTHQYTSQYKNNRTLSILPVQAHFNSNKYKTKKPIPSNNTVSFKGFLESIETDSTGNAASFHISVDNINFLGCTTVSPSGTGNTGIYIFLHFSTICIISSFSKAQPPLHVCLTSNSTLIRPCLALHQKLPYRTHPVPPGLTQN